MRYHDYHPYMHNGDGPHAWAWILFILLVVLLVGLIVFVLARLTGARPSWAPALAPPGGPREDPLELLRLRYARGEVDRDTFLQTSQDLGAGPSAPG